MAELGGFGQEQEPRDVLQDDVTGASSEPELVDQSYLNQLTSEQRAKLEDEWKAELAKTEDEISTLRQVLSARLKHAQDLKKKLGIGAWQELTNDLQQSIKTVQETTAYQKTSETVKFAAEKTTDIFGSLGDSISKRLGDVKNSSAFKSFEERVGSAVGTVKPGTTNQPPSEPSPPAI
ncbi:putative protein F13E6.1 [Fragariocoptes setiger]|uniref:Tumor protein D52 n=1 Tax=Fragariocoptes setiger TaxID=1670756 RepID=A0ABQ7S9Y0_9ACAR|nr:putative protein F13E6.1 [Fragariocoptes setiger]